MSSTLDVTGETNLVTCCAVGALAVLVVFLGCFHNLLVGPVLAATGSAGL